MLDISVKFIRYVSLAADAFGSSDPLVRECHVTNEITECRRFRSQKVPHNDCGALVSTKVYVSI